MPEIAITGVGVVSPIGIGEEAVLDSLLQCRSGLRGLEHPGLSRAFPVAPVEAEFGSGFTRIELPFLDRTTQMAIVASRQATEAAGITDFTDFGERAGVFYGTVRGGGHTEWEWVRQFYVDGRKTAKPYVIMGCMANAPAAQLSIRHQVRGPVASHTSACSSSGASIADACRHIHAGELDIAIAGGAEGVLSPVFLGAWDGLRAMAAVADDPSRSCRPFSRDRTGLALGEGAVFFVLESLQHARARGARVLGRISGWAVASDAHHIGTPHARGQISAMRSALRMAGLEPRQLDYVNAHATATRGGDPIEAAALREVLGDAAPRVPVSGTKGLHAHMLGAASAMEALVCLQAIRHRFVPATAHLEDVDPDCEGLHHVPQVLRDRRVRHALSLSAGFGGTNAALVLSEAEAH